MEGILETGHYAILLTLPVITLYTTVCFYVFFTWLLVVMEKCRYDVVSLNTRGSR